jgi:hypothetical protein
MIVHLLAWGGMTAASAAVLPFAWIERLVIDATAFVALAHISHSHCRYWRLKKARRKRL